LAKARISRSIGIPLTKSGRERKLGKIVSGGGYWVMAAFWIGMRPLKNVQFWSRSRKAKISTTGIYGIFRGLKFEPDAEFEQKGTFFKGLGIPVAVITIICNL
jgi:hypothetical protein